MGILDQIARLQGKPAAPAAPAPRLLGKGVAEELRNRLIAQRSDYLQQELKRAQREDPDWIEEPSTEDWPRILALPERHEATLEDAEASSFSELDAFAHSRGVRLRRAQVDAIRQFEEGDGLLAQIAVGEGKCSRGSTEVYDTRTGKRWQIQDLVRASLRTPSMRESTGQIESQEAFAEPSGEKPCVRVELKLGQVTEVSTDHPVFTSRGWVPAAELRPGDLVAVPRRLPAPDRLLELAPELVKFLAYMAADGCYSGEQQPTFSDDNQSVLAEFQDAVIALGGTCSERAKKSKATEYAICGLTPLMREWGLRNQLSRVKRLPASLYGMSNFDCALFLNRFIACDGHIALTPRLVEITLASSGLVDDLRHLLLRLGVISQKSFKDAYIGEKHFDAWKLTISGKENVEHLFAQIGLIHGQEEKSEELLKRCAQVVGNTNIDIVPLSQQHHRELSAEFPFGKKGLVGELHLTAGQWLGRRAFEQWVERTGYAGKYAWLAKTDLLWTPVKSVTPIGIHPVYDMSVPETQSWIADGIVVHNTLICVSIIARAHRAGRAKRSLLLVPAQVYQQFVKQELQKIRGWIPLPVRFFGLGGLQAAVRKRVASQPGQGCWVMPYSMLSSKDSRDLLAAVAPDLAVCDEAHLLKNKDSARTKRLLDYLKHAPKTRAAFLSGTLTNKSLLDFHHLLVRALGERAPAPLGANAAALWAGILGAGSLGSESHVRELAPLHRWAEPRISGPLPHTIDGYRKAFRTRLGSSPGVVLTTEDELGVSLCFENLDVPEPGPELQEKIKDVQELWVAPNGDEIAHALHTFKWLDELHAGFFYDLQWPEPRDEEHRERIDRAREHHAARQIYERTLRLFLQATSIPNLDTPMLVGNALSREATRKLVPEDVRRSWDEMKSLVFEGMPERIQNPVRVDDYKVRLAVDWAKEHKAGIIWCRHDEMIDWVCHYLREAGIDHYPAKAGNEEIIQVENGTRIAVASVMSHYQGKNLQYHYHKNLVLQWPRSASVAEQMIGRTHRQGQPEDELTIHLALGMEWEHQLYSATLLDALYVQTSMGARQKILYGTYTAPPRIYEPRLLDALGFSMDKKNPVTGRQLRDVFGL